MTPIANNIGIMLSDEEANLLCVVAQSRKALPRGYMISYVRDHSVSDDVRAIAALMLGGKPSESPRGIQQKTLADHFINWADSLGRKE